jgi:hypothetical protein
MEAHQRTELVDALVAEARQMIMVLLKASTAPDMSWEMGQPPKARFTLASRTPSRMSANGGRRCSRTSRKHGRCWGRSSNRNGTEGWARNGGCW